MLLAACGGLPPAEPPVVKPLPAAAQEVVLFSIGLINIGYRFGGKNPEAGLDCSGMVSYIFQQAANRRVGGNAAAIAQQGRPIAKNELRPGDLVFFNTLGKPLSHVGLYIGEGRFIHAPSTRGKVRVDPLEARYYVERFETARRYFE